MPTTPEDKQSSHDQAVILNSLKGGGNTCATNVELQPTAAVVIRGGKKKIDSSISLDSL